jgi:GNAT superfamily N-acetyltransferase
VIRLLTLNDIPQALDLSSGAGWNQIAEDWQTILKLGPDSCFAVDCDGQLAATTTLVCYGQKLAWLGMVLTKPAFQRRGFARMLVERALEVADTRGIETVKLDATAQGQPVYERLGFLVEQDIQRWSGRGLKLTGESDIRHEPDWSAFPAERRRLLESLSRRAKPVGDGKEFVMRRDGRRASYLGPCVARTREGAAGLIAAALACDDGRWLWDLLPANSSAVALATDFGFRVERRLTRMYRGARLQGDESMIYAIAGFEFG